MVIVHNNEAMDMDTYVFSDKYFDYCIVNRMSLTKYYGREPGEYESYPIAILVDSLDIILGNQWLADLLAVDVITTRLFQPADITRLEVIGKSGRELSHWLDGSRYALSIQDEGRTLKLFEVPR